MRQFKNYVQKLNKRYLENYAQLLTGHAIDFFRNENRLFEKFLNSFIKMTEEQTSVKNKNLSTYSKIQPVTTVHGAELNEFDGQSHCYNIVLAYILRWANAAVGFS